MSTVDLRSPIIDVPCRLNGKDTYLQARAGSRLLDVLRENSLLTGVKEGCGEGECGACTVMLDSKAVCSCVVLAQTVRNCEIITIEGLSPRNKGLHPVQVAIYEEMGTQCGFCTPGVIIAAAAMLDENCEVSELELLDGISGTLCRCTGYTKIISAVKKAQQEMITLKESHV